MVTFPIQNDIYTVHEGPKFFGYDDKQSQGICYKLNMVRVFKRVVWSLQN